MATITHTSPVKPAEGAASGSRRLESLDVLRGLTIAVMTLVNNPGADPSYWPLNHADELMSEHPTGGYPGQWWVAANGWTPTDLVFPFFLFLVGISMVLSFASRQARGDTRRVLMKHAVLRTFWILAIGYIIRILPYADFAHMRIPGVLQRIAVVYLFASIITLWTGHRARFYWIAGLLVGYYAIMRFIPVPGCDPSGWMTQHCSLAGFVDRKLMLGHLYRKDFDPEGVLSTFPSIATTLLGVLAGEFLSSPISLARKMRGLLIAGVIAAVAGYAWHPWFPIYKPLWTSSYVLFMAGAASLSLALCWWLIEMRNWRAWGKPFLWLGSNAILIYALSSFASKLGGIIHVHDGANSISLQGWVYQHWFEPLGKTENASLAFSLSYVLLWTLIAWAFYRKKIFVKV